jgi:hypothetical protein
MSIPHTVADVIDQHVTLELECLDRVYLNVYQPKLQYPKAVYYFLREQYGTGAVSSRQMSIVTQRFLKNIDEYAQKQQIPIITFAKGERKEAIAAQFLVEYPHDEGILFIGKAQEKVRTFRTEGRRNDRGETYPWIVETTAMVNQYYFYGVDEDFGRFFLKYSSYFRNRSRAVRGLVHFSAKPRCLAKQVPRRKHGPVPFRPKGTVPFSRRKRSLRWEAALPPRKLGQSPVNGYSAQVAAPSSLSVLRV